MFVWDDDELVRDVDHLSGSATTVTAPDDYTITMDYDLFDRPIRTTYPDGTYEETTIV